MLNKNFGLQGQFKIDVYKKDNQLRSTTDYFDNFITATGLSYPFYLAFADCFRYASVGTGNNPNSISIGSDTTGLYSGLNLSGYSYVGGGKSSCYESRNKYHSKGCGYRIDNSGIVLNRAWRIPEDTGSFFTNDIVLREYMLTPSLPPTTGWSYNSEFGTYSSGNSACKCDSAVYTNSGSFAVSYGFEHKELAEYYLDKNGYNLCDAHKAFTRVVRDISVLKDDFLIVNYSLTVNYETGVKYFQIVPQQDTNLKGSLTNEYDNWKPSNGLSGVYSLIHPGVKLINDGTIKSVAYVDDFSVGLYGSSFPYDVKGESFVPPLGDPMEPYNDHTNVYSYLSNDSLSFLVNEVSGGKMPTGEYFPYNTNGKGWPSGTLGFHKNWIDLTSDGKTALGGKMGSPVTYGIQYFNKPRSSLYSSENIYPKQSDFSISTNAEGIGLSVFEQGGTSSHSILAFSDSTDRTRAVKKSYQFSNPNLDETYPVRSMVLTHNPFVSFYYPFLDVCFAPVSGYPFKTYGGGVMTKINTGSLTYESPLNQINYTVDYHSGYNYFDGYNTLQVVFLHSWSSPCSPSVIGC